MTHSTIFISVLLRNPSHLLSLPSLPSSNLQTHKIQFTNLLVCGFFLGGGGILQSLLQGLQPVFNRLESAFMIAGINPAP
jgi:hypothetical protein